MTDTPAPESEPEAVEASHLVQQLRDVASRTSNEDDHVIVHLAADALSLPSPAGREEGLAARDVLAERQRQIDVEDWKPEHDDEHADGEMAMAAAAYAISSRTGNSAWARSLWPWKEWWWKPKSARQDLVRAGALIIAEIERLDRALKTEKPDAG